MLYNLLQVVLHTLGGVAAFAVLVFGFAYLIFLGDANARGQPLVSRQFDTFMLLIIYLSWFGVLWRFGYSEPLLAFACAATVMLCLIYAASYQATSSRRSQSEFPPP
jgi:hypothetical protein